MVQSKLGFYDSRNKSPTHLWRLVTGPLNDPPAVTLPVTRWLWRTVKCENEKPNFRQFWDLGKFDVHLCQGLQESGHLSMSAHETPRSSGGMHTLGATQWIPPEIAIWNLKNIKFWCVDEGVLPPVTPINLYLGGKAQKMGHFFLLQSPFLPFQNLISGLDMILGCPLSPNVSQGGEGVTETPIVSKGLRNSQLARQTSHPDAQWKLALISLRHSVNGDFCGHSRFVLWHENLTTFVSWTLDFWTPAKSESWGGGGGSP